MRKFEMMYIVTPKAEEKIESLREKITTTLEQNNATVQKFDYWGKKRLAYEINGHNDGHYVLATFECNTKCLKEVDRMMRVDEDVLRHMIIEKGVG